MDPWLARAEQLCYEGEEVAETVHLDDGGVVVTTHRVLAFDPDDEGANFQQADRPNVEAVTHAEEGERTWLERGAKLVIVGGVLAIAGSFVDLEGMVGDVSFEGASQVGGAGGVFELLQGLLAFLAILDDLLVLGGGVALLGGAAALGGYLWTRESRLRLAVAGGDDISVPTDGSTAEQAVDRLERAVAPTDDAGEGRSDAGRDEHRADDTATAGRDDPLA